MNGESNRPADKPAGIARLTPIQLAIAGLGGALVLVILMLVVSIL